MSLDTQLAALKAEPDWPCVECGTAAVVYSRARCRSCAASRRADRLGSLLAIGLILFTLWMFR